ncbi:MAG: secondary thiamine-phosphate synthase enzyme YjbQ [Methanotrichaceae archaeon]
MIVTKYIEFETQGNADMIDITAEVTEAVRESGSNAGIIVIFVPGATGVVTTIEYEPGLKKDMKDALERIAPQNLDYAHNLRWGDGNGHSHIRASVLGPSLTVPFSEARPMLGTWQQIVFLDMDNRPRSRKIVVQIMGE